MNRNVRILVICVAAIAAIGLAFVVRALGSSGQPATPAAAAPAAAPKARVLVAAKDLPPGTRLTDADMEWKDWPMDGLNPAYILDANGPQPPAAAPPAAPEEAAKPENAVAAVARRATDLAGGGTKSDFVGSVVREEIMAGEPIIARKIVRAGDSGYMAAYLEPGMRAMAIKVSVESAAGGFILPGDRVDVVLTREVTPSGRAESGGGQPVHVSSTVMQNLKVLAIDQTTRAEDDEQAVVGATATIEISPTDAETLARAKSEGELSLTLRSYADTAGPSGGAGMRQRQPAEPTTVRVYRGGAPEVVTVQ